MYAPDRTLPVRISSRDIHDYLLFKISSKMRMMNCINLSCQSLTLRWDSSGPVIASCHWAIRREVLCEWHDFPICCLNFPYSTCTLCSWLTISIKVQQFSVSWQEESDFTLSRLCLCTNKLHGVFDTLVCPLWLQWFYAYRYSKAEFVVSSFGRQWVKVPADSRAHAYLSLFHIHATLHEQARILANFTMGVSTILEIVYLSEFVMQWGESDSMIIICVHCTTCTIGGISKNGKRSHPLLWISSISFKALLTHWKSHRMS